MNRTTVTLAATLFLAALAAVVVRSCHTKPVDFNDLDHARAKLSPHFSVQSSGSSKDFAISSVPLSEQQLIDVLWGHESIISPGIAKIVAYDPDATREPPNWRRWGNVLAHGDSAFLNSIEARLQQ